MLFSELLKQADAVMTEGAIAERLRRSEDVELHPTLFNTPLIFDDHGKACLTEIYSQYREIARNASLPVLLCAPTWRVDQIRITEAGLGVDLNRHAVQFMKRLQENWNDEESPLFVGGLVGPKNDCYSPAEALSADEARDYHGWQIKELAEAGVDVIVAQTFPALSEALGIACACRDLKIPCLISFVVNRIGEIMDGTPVAEGVAKIDLETERYPVGYMVNCVYPTFLQAEKQSPKFFTRLVGIQANASSLDHADLDGSVELKQDDYREWGDKMIELNKQYGVKILGGCCGTDDTYLRYVAEGVSKQS